MGPRTDSRARDAADRRQHDPPRGLARRDELEILSLVGASRTFVRVPFLLEGLLQGAVGGCARRGAALRDLPRRVLPQLRDALELFLGGPSRASSSPRESAILVAGGAGFGLFGSAAALAARRARREAARRVRARRSGCCWRRRWPCDGESATRAGARARCGRDRDSASERIAAYEREQTRLARGARSDRPERGAPRVRGDAPRSGAAEAASARLARIEARAPRISTRDSSARGRRCRRAWSRSTRPGSVGSLRSCVFASREACASCSRASTRSASCSRTTAAARALHRRRSLDALARADASAPRRRRRAARPSAQLAARRAELESERAGKQACSPPLRERRSPRERAALDELEKRRARTRGDARRARQPRRPAPIATGGAVPFAALSAAAAAPVRGRVARRFGREVDADVPHAGLPQGRRLRRRARHAGARGRAAARCASPAGSAATGSMVIVDHGDRFFTVSGHLDAAGGRASAMRSVAAGEPIGTVGDTGSLAGRGSTSRSAQGSEAVDPGDWLARLDSGPRRARRARGPPSPRRAAIRRLRLAAAHARQVRTPCGERGPFPPRGPGRAASPRRSRAIARRGGSCRRDPLRGPLALHERARPRAPQLRRGGRRDQR